MRRLRFLRHASFVFSKSTSIEYPISGSSGTSRICAKDTHLSNLYFYRVNVESKQANINYMQPHPKLLYILVYTTCRYVIPHFLSLTVLREYPAPIAPLIHPLNLHPRMKIFLYRVYSLE